MQGDNRIEIRIDTSTQFRSLFCSIDPFWCDTDISFVRQYQRNRSLGYNNGDYII